MTLRIVKELSQDRLKGQIAFQVRPATKNLEGECWYVMQIWLDRELIIAREFDCYEDAVVVLTDTFKIPGWVILQHG